MQVQVFCMGSDFLFHTYRFLTIAGLVFCAGTYGTIGLRICRWSATVGYVFSGQRARLHYIDDFDSASFPLHSFLFFYSFTFLLPRANIYVFHSSLSTFSAWLLTLGVLNDPKVETLMNWELVKMYMICRICWRVSSREEWWRLQTYNQHTQTVFDQI